LPSIRERDDYLIDRQIGENFEKQLPFFRTFVCLFLCLSICVSECLEALCKTNYELENEDVGLFVIKDESY
jgi:hypothetical protein